MISSDGSEDQVTSVAKTPKKRNSLRSFLKDRAARIADPSNIVDLFGDGTAEPHLVEIPATPVAIKSKKSGTSSHGRKKSGEIRVLEATLRKIERYMPDGGTLPEICDRLKAAGLRYEVPATSRRAAQLIEYPEAIGTAKHYDVIRKRIRRTLGAKLLRQPARTGQNSFRPD